MPSKEQVDRVSEKLYREARQSGRDVSRESVRADVVKRAQRIDKKKSN